MPSTDALAMKIRDALGLLHADNVEEALEELALTRITNDKLFETGGESVLDRTRQLATNVTVSQQLRVQRFVPLRSEHITQLSMFGGGTAFGATPSLVKYCVFLRENDGTCNLVAQTANDTTILNTATGRFPRSLLAPWFKLRGRIYYVGFLNVTAAAAAAPLGISSVASQAGSEDIHLPKPIQIGTIAGLNDLPASFNESSLTGVSVGGMFHMTCLP